MERKRKLPARAAARVENEAKRRHSTPRERSEEPAAVPPVDEPPPPPPLPRSVQAGKPLPTVEDTQPDDLSSKEYQSIGESGVLAESLSRSRHKWIHDGLFEKYWTKPHKRKGVVNEDPKNPPKESMAKVGTVTISIEPHIIEATMFVVKDPKPRPNQQPHQSQPQSQARPIIQYGPPNASATGCPAITSPELSTKATFYTCFVARPPGPVPNVGVTTSQPLPPRPAATPSPGPSKPATSTPAASAAPAAKPATNDPVIALLAQRASADAELRDLMKRVAVGQAKQHELNHFQTIINQLNAEYKRGGGQQGPSADRLLVDGRTVRYFADEVCAILDIVLASNPNQRASDLRPPLRSDPLVVLLVKSALDDKRTKEMCRRISTGKPGFTDATDLKDILDKLHRDSKTTSQSSPASSQARQAPPVAAPNGLPNGHLQAPATQGANHPNPQALRSKGPPPATKPDISAVVFDFGTGDRYLFPKFSILEYLPANSGQQVLASFLIVRKGSMSEYGGDPELDYYQPVTMRLYTHTGRHLENLARVVAPQDEVRRYMDDVMDHMTRAEYILLAMRLPRAPKEEGDVQGGRGNDQSKTARSTPQTEKAERDKEPPAAPKPPVLWTTNAAPPKATDISRALKTREAEEETQAQYLRLINSVAARESPAL
ncbi:hypothetical protein ACO1O0_003955 [Amphichorda felina]